MQSPFFLTGRRKNMAKARKDLRGRALRKGEVQRASDKRYVYTYTDPLGRRKYIYAQDLATLREREKELMKNQLDGLDVYVAGRATINNVFDRYMSIKHNLRESTRSNYMYTYDHFVRDNFGMKLIADIKFSDVYQYYNYLLHEQELALGTLDSIHCLLHPTFQLAVRDQIIRNNPTDGVMKEISKQAGKNRGVRHALTIEQQRAFMEYVANHPVYYHWWTLFTVLLGTGCRIGEALGLRWEDLDFENRIISINHSIVYYPTVGERQSVMRISKPKTEAGIRTIPMLDVVYDAFQMEREEQDETGYNIAEIDGMTGFVFKNRYGGVPNYNSVNQAIKRIVSSHNADEVIKAKREKREPVIIPNFSCHHFRHTFATRLCEVETNLKVIQSIMGHRNIETTMDVYAEATDRKKKETMDTLSSKMDIF